jgi:predicted transcriptional regulator
MSLSDDHELLKVLTDQSVLDIVRSLYIDGPQRQRDLVERLDVSAVVVSRALGNLVRVGMVVTDGKRAPYDLTYPEKTADLVGAVADLAAFILKDRSAQADTRADALRKARMTKRSHGLTTGSETSS